MPEYQFQCPKCKRIELVQMSMKEVTETEVYCTKCSEYIDNWVVIGFLDKDERAQLDLCKMNRYYGGEAPAGIVKGGTLGSLMDTKKFKSTNMRSSDWFKEQSEKKRNDADNCGEIKIKDVE